MGGEDSGEAPMNPGGKDDCMSMLRGLDREEILEVLSGGFCHHCQIALQTRIQDLATRKRSKGISANGPRASPELPAVYSSKSDTRERNLKTSSKNTSWGFEKTPKSISSGLRKEYVTSSSPASVNSKHSPENGLSLIGRLTEFSLQTNDGLSEEQKEHVRFAQIRRQKNFVHMERVNGKQMNVLQGLELHTMVFNAEEQKKIVGCVYELQRMGQRGQLRERTYSEPSKWMRGKGRVTIQFGCCYNYAVDKNGNPPGILRAEEVDPLPPLFKQMVKQMVRWHVLPPTCVPNSCIVNIYDKGDCIPPHIDHHDFLRPFCTVSFLTECNILFGANLKIAGPGEFTGPISIPLPVGSVLILNGNGADVARHCVPGVPARRISITFRKMDESKIPYSFAPDPELQGIKTFVHTSLARAPLPQNQQEDKKVAPRAARTYLQQNQEEDKKVTPRVVANASNPSFLMENNDFPSLGSLGLQRRTH